MRAIVRRLHGREKRFAPAVENRETRAWRARLEVGRRRCGLPPISPERTAELMGRSIVEILDSDRQRVAIKSDGKASRLKRSRPMVKKIHRRLERLEARVRPADHSFSMMIHFIDPEKGMTGTLLLKSGKRSGQKLGK